MTVESAQDAQGSDLLLNGQITLQPLASVNF